MSIRSSCAGVGLNAIFPVLLAVGWWSSPAIALRAAQAQETPEKPTGKPGSNPPSDNGPSSSGKPRDSTDPDDPGKSGPATVRVARGPFQVSLELKGEFVARTRHELVLEPKAWLQPQKVLKTVPHGSRVKKGDLLLQLDREEIDRAIANTRLELEQADHAIELATTELALHERSIPIDLAEAERARESADHDLKHFLAIGRALAEESARFSLKSSEERLKYSKEELRQLELMYKDKDLTEETEEMILQRTRFEVEGAEFSLKATRISTEQALTRDIPRQEMDKREAAERAEIALQRARETLPTTAIQKRLTLSKQKTDRAQLERKLNELVADGDASTVLAPADGLLYYGREIDGNWTSSTLTSRLIRGATVSAAEVALTVVEPTPIAFRAPVEEKQLYLVHDKLRGRVEPVGYPDTRLPILLEQFNPVPANGKFVAHFEVNTTRDDPTLLPAMTGTAKLDIYKSDSALTLPSTAVFRDDDGSRFVWLVSKEAGEERSVRRTVKVGHAGDGKVELLEGLSEGNEVRASKP